MSVVDFGMGDILDGRGKKGRRAGGGNKIGRRGGSWDAINSGMLF